MPEIAEVARAVHFLRKSLSGKILSLVKAHDDANVYGKVGTTAAEVQKALMGKKVLGAGQQGKYFWLVMASPPHPVFHFGMTGWFYVRGERTINFRSHASSDEEWPPKYTKLLLETDGASKAEAAFTDSRRFGRIRLVDCPGDDIRQHTPLKENGPDPVIDKDILTVEWLEKKMNSKKVPIKAMMLDQANISGIGNWVGDEILYNAKLHPEQYSNTFSSDQIKQLHKSIRYVCQTAVDVLGDSSKFPEVWLFNHRWGKGKKDAPTTMPDGSKIVHLTVGGRTSAVVPSIQKKTGAVAGDIKSEDASDAEEKSEKDAVKTKGKATTNGKSKSAASKKKSVAKKEAGVELEEEEDESEEEVKKVTKNGAKSTTTNSNKRKAATRKVKVEDDGEEEEEEEKPAKRQKAKPIKSEEKGTDVERPNGSRRRSGRVSNGMD
ncbi:hypothetical protein HYALB_00004672 [Hymenoscyphus albidus]|uniref:Formamidopyrimidine-DNA glycosylase catalytic domain-containing protein n=1 Tax=Hymenoscyphus albidus TaxID=595503 RepID=A0A9N9Q862_9HELO|nr:hypothetical protein HYALB_00004672 [Hymenoscyphus albidus]